MKDRIVALAAAVGIFVAGTCLGWVGNNTLTRLTNLEIAHNGLASEFSKAVTPAVPPAPKK